MVVHHKLIVTEMEHNICTCRLCPSANLRNIRVQIFAGEYLKTPLGEPVKGKKNKYTELWVEKFYKKTTREILG
ncbi:unnamed protein product [Camellia sinensis]